MRQYFKYELRDPHSPGVTQDITMKITGEKQPYLLLPMKDYAADLEIIDSKGNQLIILSDHEFERMTEISMKNVKDLYLEKTGKTDSEQIMGFIKNYRVIAVLFWSGSA